MRGTLASTDRKTDHYIGPLIVAGPRERVNMQLNAFMISRPGWEEVALHQWLHGIEIGWTRTRARREADDRMQLGRRVELIAAEKLSDLGASVTLTRHKEHYDIQANGAHVEVKAARFTGGRWHWNLRESQADLYLFACVQGRRPAPAYAGVTGWFVVPCQALASRRYVEVWAVDPAHHLGQWAGYYQAWDLAEEAIRSGGHPWQMALSLEV